MKWIYAIRHKMRAAVILAGVFILIFVNNIFESRNVTELGKSFSAVYEDRLLAESYIYELSEYLHQSKIFIDNSVESGNAAALQSSLHQNNKVINNIVAAYEQTELTNKEEVIFRKVKTTLIQIREAQGRIIEANPTDQEVTQAITRLDDLYTRISGNLRILSQIQVSEGKILNDKSKHIIAGSNMASQLEIVVLITIALIIQALIFTKKSFVSSIMQQPSLN